MISMGTQNRTAAVLALTLLAPMAIDPAAAQETRGRDVGRDAAEQLEGVVVTGSRIRRTSDDSAAPVEVISEERREFAGKLNVSESVQNSSAAAGSQQANGTLGGFLASGGEGIWTVSSRGLGAQRMLMLMSGRRLPRAGVEGQVGPVDLGVIPSSIVERTEILEDGASSIYGSEAIPGVVTLRETRPPARGCSSRRAIRRSSS